MCLMRAGRCSRSTAAGPSPVAWLVGSNGNAGKLAGHQQGATSWRQQLTWQEWHAAAPRAEQQLAFMPGLDWTQASAEAWLFSCFTCLLVSRPAWNWSGSGQLAHSKLTWVCSRHSPRCPPCRSARQPRTHSRVSKGLGRAGPVVVLRCGRTRREQLDAAGRWQDMAGQQQ